MLGQGSKYRSKSDCEAKRKRKFFREKLRSENIFRLCEANNFSKLRKIAKKCEIAKKFFDAFYYFILVFKFETLVLFLMSHLIIDFFVSLVENTGKLR